MTLLAERRCAIHLLRAGQSVPAVAKQLGPPRWVRKCRKRSQIPSVATLERVIRAAGMTRPYQPLKQPEMRYPQLKVKAPQKRALYEGQVHFIRKVLADPTISVLKVAWAVPTAPPDQGLWATLVIQTAGAQGISLDAAPDVPVRKRLAAHPFQLSDPVVAQPVLPSGQLPSSLQFSNLSRAFPLVF